MKIKAAKVIVCAPSRNFTTLKIWTEDGLTGVGDATLNGRELAVASYLENHILPLLIGRDARNIEDTWQYLYRGAYWRRGPVTMAAIAAVDTALWDIKAKAANMPLYQLLGGRSRNHVSVYSHASGTDIEASLDAFGKKREQGFKYIRVQTGLEGLPRIYGTGGGEVPKAADGGALPFEESWDTSLYLRTVPKLFERVRATYGDEIEILHDTHHRLTPIEAARLGKDLEPFRLFWLEDLVPAENQEAYKLIRHHTTTPLALGEIFNSIWDCKDLIQNQLIDFIRTTCVHAGGLTHLKRIADFASVFQVRTGCHGAQDMSPICLAANVHFGHAIPNFGLQEYSAHAEVADEVFPHGYYYRDGALHITDEPGLGIDIDEDKAAAHPYERGYLPVNRLRDGTLWNW